MPARTRSDTERWGSGKPPASGSLPPVEGDDDLPSVEEALEPLFSTRPPPPPVEPDNDAGISDIAAKELLQFIQRIERLEEEKKAIADDIKDVYAELKARGFDAKAVRELVKIRRQDAQERAEQQAILELYMQALGLI